MLWFLKKITAFITRILKSRQPATMDQILPAAAGTVAGTFPQKIFHKLRKIREKSLTS